MICFHSTFQTSFGSFSIAVDESHRVCGAAFGGSDVLLRRMRTVKSSPAADETWTRDARLQVIEFLEGQRTRFDLPLALAGTPFQQRVWKALLDIPYGETRSYAQIAAVIGSGPRAVGGANADNPVCVVVPCHRVIGTNGSLTGFAFGGALKARLIALESRLRVGAAQVA